MESSNTKQLPNLQLPTATASTSSLECRDCLRTCDCDCDCDSHSHSDCNCDYERGRVPKVAILISSTDAATPKK